MQHRLSCCHWLFHRCTLIQMVARQFRMLLTVSVCDKSLSLCLV